MPIGFTVMTWNVENLFPPNHPSGSGPASPDIYQKKLYNLARTVKFISPDVIGLQEIGDLDAFNDLRRAIGDRYPFARVSKFPDVRGIRTAFLSRLPLLQAEDLVDFPPGSLVNQTGDDGKPMRRMGRGALKVTVVIAPGLLVHMLNTHLKSKLVTYSGGRRSPVDENERARGTALALVKRAAEAVALRTYLNKIMTNNTEPTLLLGDLNDGPDAVTTQLLMGPPDRSLARRDAFDDTRLYGLHEYIPGERRFSRLYYKTPELIDHIMVSHELIFYLRKADAYVEPIESVDQNTDVRRESTFPDHAPLFGRFEIPENPADRHF